MVGPAGVALLLCLVLSTAAVPPQGQQDSAEYCESDSPHQDVCMSGGEQLGTLASPSHQADSHFPGVQAFLQSFPASCSSSGASLPEPRAPFASASSTARHSSLSRAAAQVAAASQSRASEAVADEASSSSSNAADQDRSSPASSSG